MGTLFSLEIDSADISKISGLTYLREYITPDEESALARTIDDLP